MFKSINRSRAALVGALTLIVTSAQAEVPAAVSTAMAAVATDVPTYGAALVAVAIAGIGFVVGIKYLKKTPSAA